MLHVFNVNYGRMLTFDVNLAMERVLDLKNAISSSQGVHPDKQVMLISGGQALCDDERVCSYAAGTETNPVYLFDKACIEKETLQHLSEYQQDNDFSESISNALSLNSSYKTVEVRTKLAMRLHEVTRRQVNTMKALVHDEHLMYQGWQAAVANLLDTVSGFRNRVEIMRAQCQKLFDSTGKNEDVMKGMEQILSQLEKIPLLPALLKHNGAPGRFSDESFEISLLRWIETQCKNISVQAMFAECLQRKGYLSQEKYAALLEECEKVENHAGNGRMSEISGINERLAALDRLIIDAEQRVREQTGIAQGFVRNRETARELHNNPSSIDALLTLCESHITQLQIMKENDASTRNALRKCSHAKNELAANLHTRLRWLYFVQRSILNADVKLSMFTQQLCHLQRQVSFLSQVKQCPTLYLSAIAEVVRRKKFANLYVQWANKAVSEARVERDREIVKRKHFQSNIAGHFIQRLFHGFSDKPPSLAKKPLRSFDTDLPDITPENLSVLSQLLPDYKEILQIPLVNKHMESLVQQSQHMSMSAINSQISAEPTLAQSSNVTTNSTMSIGGASTSVSVSTGQNGQVRSTSGSFAVVDPPTIGQSQPGGFVVTSIEGVTQENLKDETEQAATGTTIRVSDNLPQRSYSTSAIGEDLSAAELSEANRSESDNVFAQIGDIISPESPPDSDFFSIMPGNFSFPKHSPDRPTVNLPLSEVEQNTSGASSEIEMRSGRCSTSSSMKKSSALVGSPDSNSSTSYQKVDGISSDDEMFHSFTSDPGKDLKATRKKLHQVQSEYESLLNETKQEKDELNALIRKLEARVSEMESSQLRVESDYERRWTNSKAELDDVIMQLENERIERKKAWMEGASLEKKLREVQETCSHYEAQVMNLEQKLTLEKETTEKLEAAVTKSMTNAEHKISEINKKHEQHILKVGNQHQQEVQALRITVTRLEKDLTLAQADLSSADDRIQDLETALSDHERKQEEDDIQTLDLKTTIDHLSEELKTTKESYDDSIRQHEIYEQEIAQQQTKLTKAKEQIFSLKTLLGDYESRLEDDRSKEDLLRSLKSSLHQVELEKCEISSELQSCKLEIKNHKQNAAKAEAEMQALRSVAMSDEKSHGEELEKIRVAHSEEISALSAANNEEIAALINTHEDAVRKIVEQNEKRLEELQSEWRSKEKELRNMHRNEIDEIEADRLESVAAVQQTIEDLRSKFRESSRCLDQQKKESLSLKEALAENNKTHEETLARITEENKDLRQQKSRIEDELMSCKELVQNLQNAPRVDSMTSSATSPFYAAQLTSSTEDEMESKRSKIDSGISEEMIGSLQRSSVGLSMDTNDNSMSISVDDHKKMIEIMRRNFDEDKKALQSLFKRREEEAARRRQMVFNSAIQRVTSGKDLEIQKLRGILHSQANQSAVLSQSMMVPSSAPMVSLAPSPASLPSPPSDPAAGGSPSVQTMSSSMGMSAKSTDGRERDRVAVANFQVGDTVLVCYNESYQHFTLLTTSRTLHFVHGESLEKLGITSASSEYKKTMTFATLVDKEYCQARKAQNRFRVAISTKFYRVRVAPMAKKDS